MITVRAETVDNVPTPPPPKPPTTTAAAAAAAAAVASEEIVVVHERRATAAVDIGGDGRGKSNDAGALDAVGRENWKLAQHHGVNGTASDGRRDTAAAAKGGSADSDWTGE